MIEKQTSNNEMENTEKATVKIESVLGWKDRKHPSETEETVEAWLVADGSLRLYSRNLAYSIDPEYAERMASPHYMRFVRKDDGTLTGDKDTAYYSEEDLSYFSMMIPDGCGLDKFLWGTVPFVLTAKDVKSLVPWVKNLMKNIYHYKPDEVDSYSFISDMILRAADKGCWLSFS